MEGRRKGRGEEGRGIKWNGKEGEGRGIRIPL